MTTDWRWTDEDSAELSRQNARIRAGKPKRYVPPVSTKEAEALVKRPVATLDQFVSRPSRRKAPSPEARAQREWARTREQLERAGIRPVETPSTTKLASKPQPHKPEPRPTERYCEDCRVDISHRGPTATRCESHAYQHKRQIARQRRARARARARARKENTQ